MKKHLLICCVILLLLISSFVVVSKPVQINEESTFNSPPMESPWSMYCHDTRHTGRSPYSTENNIGIEKWRFGTNGWINGGPVIDNDGIIYVGAKDLYAIYPNGTLKWEYDTPYYIMSTPAIDENGILYIGTIWAYPNYIFAIYTTNGTLKWKYKTGTDEIYSSPAIGEEGTVYFGTSGGSPWHGHINALYPNGTLKWRFEAGHEVRSDPAIGQDGTIYCGSHDGNLYALFPNNGTLKWKYGTGDWVPKGPSIADDGTIYFGSWDGYLYAVYPNSTLRWKKGGYFCGTTPITGLDGTIYVGNKNLYAIYPENGTIKWSFSLEQNEDIRDSTPCISSDGTIYFGTFEGGRIYAVNNDGTEKWHKSIGGDVLSAPAIGEDGTVYIGSPMERLYAFGPSENNPPDAPTIDGPTGVPPGTYEYKFKAIDPDGDNISYTIDWGDANSDETVFYNSGEEVTVIHTYSSRSSYIITAYAKDEHGLIGPTETNPVEISMDKSTNNVLFRLLERYPLLNRLFNLF
jgi:outer membrane protein assembly factor BamB